MIVFIKACICEYGLLWLVRFCSIMLINRLVEGQNRTDHFGKHSTLIRVQMKCILIKRLCRSVCIMVTVMVTVKATVRGCLCWFLMRPYNHMHMRPYNHMHM